jgi:hypothetical protein
MDLAEEQYGHIIFTNKKKHCLKKKITLNHVSIYRVNNNYCLSWQ